MSKFDALYNTIISEQAVAPPPHREGLKPHIEMIGNIVKRQNINKQPEVINNIMQGITNPNQKQDLNQFGTELPDLVQKIGSYIQQQPSEHQSDVIEQVRQSITHPANK